MHIYSTFCLYLALVAAFIPFISLTALFFYFPYHLAYYQVRIFSDVFSRLFQVTCLHSIVITEIDIVYISNAQFYLIHGTSKHASEMCKTTRKIIWDSFVHIVYMLVGLVQIKHFTSYVLIYLKVETITDILANVQWRINAF